ncbi:hypothetical protein BC830DRAFT_1085375, partial [Chytriomyces sp. MP71]
LEVTKSAPTTPYETSSVDFKPAMASKVPDTPSKKLDKFDRALLNLFKQLEEEEEIGVDMAVDADAEEEEEEEEEEDEYERAFNNDDDDDFNIPVIQQYQESSDVETEDEADSDDDTSDSELHARLPASQTPEKSSLPRSAPIPAIKSPADIYTNMKRVADVAKSNPAPTASTGIFLQDRITEHKHNPDEGEESDGDMSEDAFEDYIFGRELAKQYHERRAVILAQQNKILDRLPDEVKEKIELNEESRNTSRFRASKIGYSTGTPSLQDEIRAYLEQQKHEESSVAILPGKEVADKATPAQATGILHTSKPRFKPTLKPKKRVSFSEESLVTPEATSIPTSADLAIETQREPRPVVEVVKERIMPAISNESLSKTREAATLVSNVSAFKAARLKAASVSPPAASGPILEPAVMEAIASSKPVSAFKSAKILAAASAITDSGVAKPGVRAEVATFTSQPDSVNADPAPAKRVSAFKAARMQAASSSASTTPFNEVPPATTSGSTVKAVQLQPAASSAQASTRSVVSRVSVAVPAVKAISSSKSAVTKLAPPAAKTVLASETYRSNASVSNMSSEASAEVVVGRRPVQDVVMERSVLDAFPVREEIQRDEAPIKKSLFRAMREK